MKHFVTYVLLVIFSTASYSQSNSLLWKISGNNLNNPSYLFGTIHMIPKADYFFTSEMKTAFENCETLALEVNVNDMSFAEKIELAKQAILSEGETLEKIMGSEKYKEFKTYLIDTLKIKPAKIEKYNKVKPFFVTGIILKDYLGGIKAYEDELSSKAKKNKMNVVGLETIQDQLDVVKSFSKTEQIDMLTEELDVRDYNKMVEVYKTQNIDSLYTMSNEQMEEDSEMMDKLANDRNAKWIAGIEKLTSEKSTFIAVGALHLPGEKGVISLLKQKGYTVEPVLSN